MVNKDKLKVIQFKNTSYVHLKNQDKTFFEGGQGINIFKLKISSSHNTEQHGKLKLL